MQYSARLTIMRGKSMRASNGGLSTKCLFPVNWSVKLLSGFIAKTAFATAI